MNVSYRGIAYETEIPVVEGTDTDRTALFLGNRFKVDNIMSASIMSASGTPPLCS